MSKIKQKTRAQKRKAMQSSADGIPYANITDHEIVECVHHFTADFHAVSNTADPLIRSALYAKIFDRIVTRRGFDPGRYGEQRSAFAERALEARLVFNSLGNIRVNSPAPPQITH